MGNHGEVTEMADEKQWVGNDLHPDLVSDLQEEEEESDSIFAVDGTPINYVSSRVLHLLGDLTSGAAHRFTAWLDLVRRRSGRYPSSGFPNRSQKIESMVVRPKSFDLQRDAPAESLTFSETSQDVSLWERLGKAHTMDIESNQFCWGSLSSLHHTEHSTSREHSEEQIKAIEVKVNSGGVVFFALFNNYESNDPSIKEAVAVIKFSSSRITTQSERLGYEFAKILRVQTPQVRVVHNSSSEWQHIKNAAQKAKAAAVSKGDEVTEMTCRELLEALEMSRCLLLMNYVHGSPLLESSNAFNTQEVAENTAQALGRVLILDLVLRNEDRLPCHQLGWRGNLGNLLYAEKVHSSYPSSLEEAFDSSLDSHKPKFGRSLHIQRCISVDSISGPHKNELLSHISNFSERSELIDFPKSINIETSSQLQISCDSNDFNVVAIDSVVPRRPPSRKAANDRTQYPNLVELLLNSDEYASNLLYEITVGKMGFPKLENASVNIETRQLDMIKIISKFKGAFRQALRDLQKFHIFILTLYQKLDNLSRLFLTIINKDAMRDSDREYGVSETQVQKDGHVLNHSSPDSGEKIHGSLMESQRSHTKSSSSGNKEISHSTSPSKVNWHGKCSRGSGELPYDLRLTLKLRDFNKCTKVDSDLSTELEQWNEMLKTEVIKLCQENNFKTGFFEGGDNQNFVDAYELKVRLGHILERITLISDAANTEKPSFITGNLFIGGALAARSRHTLQHLGITHILCLCSNEIGQSESQCQKLFQYKNFSISDEENAEISDLFPEASDFIDQVEDSKGKVLVHCFEGKSRSATIVLAYLMSRKNFTLLEAWNLLKKSHRKTQPNDGFAKILSDLDIKLHGKASMEWQNKKPVIRMCPICGKNTGLSTESLNLHLRKKHSETVLGSADGALSMEIHKFMASLKKPYA